MNKAKVINALSEALKGIKSHPDVGEEILDLIAKSGHEKEFFNLFERRIAQTRQLKHTVTLLDEFEKLSGHPNLYSMHLESKNFNIRILYSYYATDEILLHCFYERDGKSCTSYETHIPIAISRLKDMEGYL